MTNLTPTAIVIDRATANEPTSIVSRSMKELGGAWPDMFDLWKQTTMPYLILLAHTPERLRQRAPLTLMPADEDALRNTLHHCFADVKGMRVQWVLLMAKGSAGRKLTEDALLSDFVPGGSA